jgi:hypothetical protein
MCTIVPMKMNKILTGKRKDMKKHLFIGTASMILAVLPLISYGKTELVNSGKSKYRIIVPKSALEVEKYAALELQDHLKKISGAKLPIVTDAVKPSRGDILLGRNQYFSKIKFSVNFKKLGKEGFAIKTHGKNLIIAGNGRGLLYGVYTFLEKYLGCRWYTAEVSHIPKKKTIVLEDIEDIQVPVLEFREIYYSGAMDPAFAGIHKLNGNISKVGIRNNTPERKGISQERHGGWGYWCHSFYNLVPPETYFKKHPEYYSMINGARKHQNTQLCLSNSDVLKITLKKLKKEMAKPEKDLPVWADKYSYFWSVSQNDGGGQCQCPECTKLNSKEGTPMGSMLPFVNKVAEQFPDKKIATLAYVYSRRAPKHCKPASNVAIQLCGIETGRRAANIPIENGIHANFGRDMREWGKISDHIIVWDYVVQFQNLMAPFPNLRVLQPNMQFFVKNNAKGVFEQGNREKGGEFCELRAYVLAKLLWDPGCDVDAVMNDFLNGYYGKAGPAIRKYIDLMHDNLEKSGATLSIDGNPGRHRNGYLSEAAVKTYNKLFDEAEKQVKDNLEILFRVRTARLPVMFAQLQLGYGSVELRRKIAMEFFELLEKNEIWMLSEVDWRKDQAGNREKYRAHLNRTLK